MEIKGTMKPLLCGHPKWGPTLNKGHFAITQGEGSYEAEANMLFSPLMYTFKKDFGHFKGWLEYVVSELSTPNSDTLAQTSRSRYNYYNCRLWFDRDLMSHSTNAFMGSPDCAVNTHELFEEDVEDSMPFVSHDTIGKEHDTYHEVFTISEQSNFPLTNFEVSDIEANRQEEPGSELCRCLCTDLCRLMCRWRPARQTINTYTSQGNGYTTV